MTFRELSAWIIGTGALAVALLAILSLVNLVLVRPLRRWLETELDRRITDHEEDHHKEN